MRHSLIPQYRKMHADAHFSGVSIYAYTTPLSELIVSSGAKTLLDYGSGKGRQYHEGNIHELWGGIMPVLYDPAVSGLDRRPEGVFDGVICTDVLEHVPEYELKATLADIRQYARMWAFLAICCEPAKKCLPDGRNVHVTLRPQEWWLECVAAAFKNGPEVHVHFERPHEQSKPPTARKIPKEERRRLGWTT